MSCDAVLVVKIGQGVRSDGVALGHRSKVMSRYNERVSRTINGNGDILCYIRCAVVDRDRPSFGVTLAFVQSVQRAVVNRVGPINLADPSFVSFETVAVSAPKAELLLWVVDVRLFETVTESLLVSAIVK